MGLTKRIDTQDPHVGQWPNSNVVAQPSAHPQHLSASSFSSTVPSYRSSNNSAFSGSSLRGSVASSVSDWSHSSSLSRDQHVLQTEYLLSNGPSTQTSYTPSPVEDVKSLIAKRRPAKKPVAQEKDYFKTCVSANKQSRTCSKEYKYFCTSCGRPFVEKADWKRHEETFQERPEMFQCDLCPAIYFLDKDFIAHHVKSHRCAPCSGNTKWDKKTHVMSARKRRMVRTGWGCGFCCHFSSDWTERCNHIAHHMEKEGLTASHWIHSNVIQSLLQRPPVYYEWRRILQGMAPTTTLCSWNNHSTGRVEGYPDSNPNPQLQDYLEYYTPDQNETLLAHLAYKKMVKHPPPSQSPAPPPVPPKDHRGKTLQDLTEDTESWTQFINSVVEDDVLPQGVCHLDSWYDN